MNKFIRATIFLILTLNFSCVDILKNITGIDLPAIQKKGKLVAYTSYNANSYFLYKGRPMGFEYELLSLLARELGVILDLRPSNESDDIIHTINDPESDIIAANIEVTKSRNKIYTFTDHLITTSQVLIQKRRPNTKLISSPVDLIDKTIHLYKHSPYHHRMLNLFEEIGGDANLVFPQGSSTTTSLIKSVAKGEIEYTIADQNLALINQAYYPSLHVSTKVSFPQRIAWVLKPKSKLLKEKVNLWIAKIKRNGQLNAIYKKYYKKQRVFAQINSKFNSVKGGRISKFDNLLKNGALKLNWDWRLIASLTFQESRFNPSAKSWAGARGLMQVMPSTSKGFGGGNLFNPKQNVKVGINYLKFLIKMWSKKISDPEELKNFVIASYNAGPGHVLDAQKLAEKYGKDKNKWFDNVDYFILNLADPKYYKDSVVKYGYCRGDEPFLYVKEIRHRYKMYQKFISL